MVSTSNDGIMSEYLVKYGIIKVGERNRPTDLLETLYIADRYRAGDDLQSARATTIFRCGVGSMRARSRPGSPGSTIS